MMEPIENNQTKNVMIYHVPELRKKGICPVCKQKVDYRKSADLVLVSCNGETHPVSEEICFCRKCHLFLIDKEVKNRIGRFRDYGYHASILQVSDGDDVEIIKNKMLEPIKQEAKTNPLKANKKKWIRWERL